MDFDNLAYLQYGSKRQIDAYFTLTDNQIFSKLKPYDPILVGTIPINIDIESSDLDIICCFADKQEFEKSVTNHFKKEREFTIREIQSLASSAIVANFFVGEFRIEIFGQSIPTKQQHAYRHLITEHQLLNRYGKEFRHQIIELKRQGYKTEPAFAMLLGLSGDPYTALLEFELTEKKGEL